MTSVPGTLHSVSDGQNACGLNIDSLQWLSGQGFWLLILQKRTLNPVVISVIGVVVEAPTCADWSAASAVALY